ncbi:hypothetical protein OPT61_g5189 [Boeremia exigua]|uniref:Uncharacterized protein n=1 Tax=Boeremia exigua TaxID=749465 RepID=A0ACC2IBH7_9PLEO|nr:hypothetical protein OPT61_g5189 [Boeremia exigua]
MSLVTLRNEPLPGADFEYDSLCNSKSKRLLKVLSTKANSMVQIQLWEESTAMPYSCLSYTWGAPTPTLPILVEGRVMRVGRNLHEFLVVAAERFANMPLWIDAICINQSDNVEKGVQVQRMGDTFKEATEVLVWLGNDEGVARLFDFSNSPSPWLHKARYYLPFQRLPKSLRAPAIRLKDHGYWKRAWVIQELTLARSLRLLCGSSETTLERLETSTGTGSFTHAVPVSLISGVVWDAALVCDLLLGMVPVFIRLVLARPSALDIDELFEFLHHNPGIVSKGAPFSFWSILKRHALCQNPPDRLYSILAITEIAKRFEVNYGESAVQTFWRAAEHFAAWHSHLRLHILWKALEIDRETLWSELSSASGTTMHCSIAMRPCEMVTQLSRGHRHTFCELERWPDHSDALRGFESGDLLLCPYPAQEEDELHIGVTHFRLAPNEDASDGFTVSAFMQYMNLHVLLSQYSELWSSKDGTLARVITWTEATHLAALGGGANQDWKTKPHFILKTDHHYVLPFATSARDWLD